MSIQNEFTIYLQNGGTENLQQYTQRLMYHRTQMGIFISDHKNAIGEIGFQIFSCLNLSSQIAFSQTAKSCYIRSKKEWFVLNYREIVLQYIQRGTYFKDFVCDGGWKAGAVAALKIAGVALTIGSGIKSYQHTTQIPPDAPTKTMLVENPYTECQEEMSYIDHPEAYKAGNWAACSITSGIITGALIAEGFFQTLVGIDIDLFFSDAQKDIIQNYQDSLFIKCTLPGFRDWKLKKMKEQLTLNPIGWQQDARLSTMICPISQSFMLFPVRDICGHYYDYRSLRAFQLTNHVNPLKCPLNLNPNNNGLMMIKFDKGRFDSIQARLLNVSISSSSETSTSSVSLDELIEIDSDG